MLMMMIDDVKVEKIRENTFMATAAAFRGFSDSIIRDSSMLVNRYFLVFTVLNYLKTMLLMRYVVIV